ncbi:MAG: peroxiredoxin family protein [Vicinamibacteria bacterium]
MIAIALLAAGLSILGQPVPEWPAKGPESWVSGGPLTLADLRGKVVLIRFFMEADCPLCRGTAPALNEFHRDFAPRGLVVVGMYTPKPRPRPVEVELVREYVEAYGFEFAVAVDDDWSALRRLWLDRVPDAAYTSASLLIDRRGILRHAHEGGIYAKDAGGPGARRDYEEMRAAIEKLLAEP